MKSYKLIHVEMSKKNYGVARQIQTRELEIPFEANPLPQDYVFVDVFCPQCNIDLTIRMRPTDKNYRLKQEQNNIIISVVVILITLTLTFTVNPLFGIITGFVGLYLLGTLSEIYSTVNFADIWKGGPEGSMYGFKV